MPAIRWFAYPCPNRRTDTPVVEITLEFSADDQHNRSRHTRFVKKILVNSGIINKDEVFPNVALPDDGMGWYTSLLVQTALLFQCKAGHRVSFFTFSCYPDQNRSMALLEHEHCDVGLTAVKLAVEVVSGQREHLAKPFQAFKAFAKERLLPWDTEAIIKAARRRDIPSIRLERLPFKRQDFEELTGGECIRRNGLLMLGHGTHQHVLDGTFCIDLSSNYRDLRVDADQRQLLLKKLGVPVKTPGDGMTNAEQYHLIAVNGHVTAVVRQADRKTFPPAILDNSIVDHVLKIGCETGFAPVVVTVVSADISCSGSQGESCVLDFELAPELDQYLESNGDLATNLMHSTADMIIDWLFHGKEQTRVPIIAVTGTNGKTTTTRMINHILVSAGLEPGMVCTDGVYLNGKQIIKGDQSTITGHLQVLTNKAVNATVLETHHAGILRNGFAFRWCDIAICLNVTEDHLGRMNIETVEQMAEIKQSLPERARQAAVLNADDQYCLAMADAMVAEKVCLVSMKYSIDQLRTMVGSDNICCCVLDPVESGEWMVIHDQGHRVPVIDVASIPITFNGTARFNISNAMHAALASYLQGIPVEVIKTALSGIEASYETTPGRLNIFDNLPFRVVMDFAHNPDGLRHLCEFVDLQTVDGRRVIAFAGSSSRTDETIKKMAHSVAGHFDFYFCKEYAPSSGREKRLTAHILQQGLMESGVASEQTAVRTFGREVIFEILDNCQPGDLLVMALGHVEKHQLAGFIDEYIEAGA